MIQSNKIESWFSSLTESIPHALAIVCYFVIFSQLINAPAHAGPIASKAVSKKKEGDTSIIMWHVTQYVHVILNRGVSRILIRRVLI